MKIFASALSKETLDVYFTSYDLKRLQMYSNNMADYHLIMDLIPSLARLYFLNMMGDTHFSAVQSVKNLGHIQHLHFIYDFLIL